MNPTTSVAVVLVTHNSEGFLDDTLASIDAQTRPADICIAVDDYSTDATREHLTARDFTVQLATSPATDPTTRIAQNFHQALRLAVAEGADLVVLGDHDDVWHRERIEHQCAVLQESPTIAMLASDGFLIDEHGAAVPGTIRSTFPIPEDFNDQPLRAQIAYAARHSIATGGASALRPSMLPDWSVPPGWLHDRWWSLVSIRAGAFLADATPVIDYRLSAGQEVGLDAAQQDAPARWLVNKARGLGRTTSRARDLTRLIRP
ncbi:MAG TPA: glycosyltransferase [Acidimicrobiia bacterium]